MITHIVSVEVKKKDNQMVIYIESHSSAGTMTGSVLGPNNFWISAEGFLFSV